MLCIECNYFGRLRLLNTISLKTFNIHEKAVQLKFKEKLHTLNDVEGITKYIIIIMLKRQTAVNTKIQELNETRSLVITLPLPITQVLNFVILESIVK